MTLIKLDDNLQAEGYTLVRTDEEQGLLTVFNEETEVYELWAESPNYSGFTLIHLGTEYEFCHNITRTVAYGRCDSCEVLRINGVVCHEKGCPRTEEENR